MKIDVQTITPADAVTLLASAAPNRKYIRRRVAALADEMRNGVWREDGAPLKIDWHGRLLDGQHRLLAVVEADMPIDFVVISGLDPAAQLVMDTGKPRSLVDHLHIHEVPNARAAAAATRFLWDYEQGVLAWRGDVKKRPYPTLPQTASLYEKRASDIQDGVAQAQSVFRYIRMSKAVLAGMWPVLAPIDFDDASEFYDRLARKIMDGALIDSVEVLSKRMNNQNRASYGGTLGIRVQAAFFIKAWNSYRRGESISRLVFKPGGASADKFPVPV